MVSKYIDKLNHILSEDMHLIQMTGLYDQTKNDWFEQINNDEHIRYFLFKEENNKGIKLVGNRASFIGQNKVDARIYGSRHPWRL